MNWSYNNVVAGGGDQVFVDGQMMNYARWPNTSLDIWNQNNVTADNVQTTSVLMGNGRDVHVGQHFLRGQYTRWNRCRLFHHEQQRT